ncbi:phosphatase PAP2 family protein [Guptibacillus algicola]|uniref:phosphatase PAP2 family protein n=1 Tax=Guptibacillus algicola TaxID=225844 RepID=UPI001CD32899|nr:phosphatase PAP2 family protein [Alkalihalobacillus algicola]MCA0986435.1 phosphatase PAP2 family protein [Alkalihalobacillus algicola]
MSKVVGWLHEQECYVFRFLNLRCHSRYLTSFMGAFTHLGGARTTILSTLLLLIFLPYPSKTIVTISAVALLLSHLPVHFIKKHYPRNRPYLAIPETKMLVYPLKDHSFPSGHTTAIFSVVTPYFLFVPSLAVPLLAIAAIVAISRIYLGHHYPSDVLVGALLGMGSAFVSAMFIT